jgi:hypothetical protein
MTDMWFQMRALTSIRVHFNFVCYVLIPEREQEVREGVSLARFRR